MKQAIACNGWRTGQRPNMRPPRRGSSAEPTGLRCGIHTASCTVLRHRTRSMLRTTLCGHAYFAS